MPLMNIRMNTYHAARSVVGSVCLACAVWCAVAVPIGCAPRQPVANPVTAKPQDELKGINLYADGAQAYRRGDKEQARVTLERAVQENPNLRMARVMLGDIYRAKGDYANAAAHYGAASRLDPYTLTNHYNLGVMNQLLRRFQDAAAAYLKALDLDPRDLRSNMNLGTVYLALGQLDESINYLERATMIKPDSAEAWSNLGVAYDASGRISLAEQAYRRALELDGAPVATMQNLGSNLVSQGKPNEAIAVMREVVQRSDTPSAHKRYGDALALGKQYDAALEEYAKALRLNDKYYPAMNEKGFVLLRQYQAGMELDRDKLKEAVSLWKTSLRLNPQQPRIQEAVKQSDRPGLLGSGT